MAWFEVLKNGQQVSFGELDDDKAIYFAFGYREALIRSGLTIETDMRPTKQYVRSLDKDRNLIEMTVEGINRD